MTNGPKPQSANILLVLPEVFSCSGGIQMFGRALCLAAGRWANQRGGSVTALVLNDTNKVDDRYVNHGFEYHGMGKSKPNLVARFLRLVASKRFDWIIFGHISLTPLALMAKTLNPGAKTAVVTYGIEVWQPLSQPERLGLKRTDLILAISEFTKNEVMKHNAVAPEKIRIFPCTLDPHWAIPARTNHTEASTAVLLSVTRMNTEDDYKGIDSVIKSLPQVVRSFGALEFRIVGDGTDVPRLKALAAEVGVEPYVKFMGALSDSDLRRQYQECTVFVMPSSREGFGIVFLEAMAFGKPVVGGAHGGTPSVVKDGETGLLVENSDVDGIADALTRLLSEPDLRERFGQAGRQRLLDQFTFESFERNFAEVVSAFPVP